jgi:fluoroquinolone transport system permease protein
MTFLIGDFKNITRDSMLLGALLAPIALALFVKISVPFISDFVFEMFSINILDHYTFIMSFLIILSHFMLATPVGCVTAM